MATDERGAVGGLQDGGQHAQRGGFAGAIGAQQAIDLAGLAGEGDVIDGANLAAFFVVKDLHETVGFDHGIIPLVKERTGGWQPCADENTQVWRERYQSANAEIERKETLALVALRALFGIELISGHAKDVVALDANAMNVASERVRGTNRSFV